MPGRRKDEARVLGPYPIEAQGYYKVTTVFPGTAEAAGSRRDRYFGDKQEAIDYAKVKREEIARMNGRTVNDALDAYEPVLKERGLKDKSVVELMRRLRLFFRAAGETQLARLQPDRAKELYVAFAGERSVDYHRNALGNAKTFLKWGVEQGWATSNVLEAVKGKGRRKTGKEQLTGDEARKFYQAAMRLADAGDAGGLGAAMLLLMGLRQSEVSKRRVRDLDLGCTVLRIEDAKTKKGNRIVGVPTALQPRLYQLVEGRQPMEVMFAGQDGGEHTKAWLYFAVRRVCREAKVPEVCPHGLRGTWATLAMRAGQASQAVADELGHEDAQTTLRFYAQPAAAKAAAAERTLVVISGGRSG